MPDFDFIKEQEKIVQKLAVKCPYVRVSIEVDPDAAAQAYLRDADDQ